MFLELKPHYGLQVRICKCLTHNFILVGGGKASKRATLAGWCQIYSKSSIQSWDTFISVTLSLSPSLVSVWSVCWAVSSASWSCRARSWTNTVWSVGVAPSSAGTADATSPWGTSPSTAWPAQPLTMAQVLLRLPANCHQTRVRGCKLWGFGTNPNELPEHIFFLI